MDPGAGDLPKPSRAELRRFGLVTGGALLVLLGCLLPWLLKRPFPRWPWALGASLAAVALIAPNTLRIIHVPWMRLALLINRITTPLIAGAIFFLVILPVGWIMRRAGNDPMARRLERDAPSYRVASRVSPPSSMERPF
jgi:hypothetical protein